jgi:uncharacterized protein YjgD (DUF1641 family)
MAVARVSNQVSAIPIIATGFGWTPVLLTIANLLIGGVFVAIIRTRPALKKIANEREANLLSERAEEMDTMRGRITKLEAKAELKDVLHEAERSYDRHRINNLAASLNAFFLMVKSHPEDAAKAAAAIEDMRARQIEQENKENIALRELVAKFAAEKGIGE